MKAKTITKLPVVAGSARVFVVQRPRPKADGWSPNIQDASKYGRFHFIFDMGYRAFADTGTALSKAKAALADFNPDRDYILDISFGCDPMCGVVVAWALAQQFGYDNTKVKYLCWNRKVGAGGTIDKTNGHYIPQDVG